MRKFPEASDGKLEQRMTKTDLKAEEMNSSSFNGYRVDWKDLLSLAGGRKTMHPLSGMIAHSPTNSSRLSRQ